MSPSVAGPGQPGSVAQSRPQTATTPQQAATPQGPRPPLQAVARASPSVAPQSAVAPPGSRPLTTEAALAQSRQSYSNGTNGATPIGTVPSAVSTPAIQAMKEPTQTAYHIPRTMNPSTINPVAVAQARPTLTGGSNMSANSVMNQPALQKTPAFDLEDGRRVLSKKKLDELVRQVTGGVEGEVLDPDVEEVRLSTCCPGTFKINNHITVHAQPGRRVR
jgi:transcription initiation factor TFIID subunit 12